MSHGEPVNLKTTYFEHAGWNDIDRPRCRCWSICWRVDGLPCGEKKLGRGGEDQKKDIVASAALQTPFTVVGFNAPGGTPPLGKSVQHILKDEAKDGKKSV